MKLLQKRTCYQCSLKEAKKLVKERYPKAVIWHKDDLLKKRGIYKNDVVWVKDRKELKKDRFNLYAIAIYKRDELGKVTHGKIPPYLELYEIYE